MSSFNTEWVTVKGPRHHHRIKLESRIGHPEAEHRFWAEIAARVVDLNGSGLARVTHVLSDEKAGNTYGLTVASTDPNDENACQIAENTLAAVSDWVPLVNFTLARQGNSTNDTYDHMTHLSEACGLIKP